MIGVDIVARAVTAELQRLGVRGASASLHGSAVLVNLLRALHPDAPCAIQIGWRSADGTTANQDLHAWIVVDGHVVDVESQATFPSIKFVLRPLAGHDHPENTGSTGQQGGKKAPRKPHLVTLPSRTRIALRSLQRAAATLARSEATYWTSIAPPAFSSIRDELLGLFRTHMTTLQLPAAHETAHVV